MLSGVLSSGLIILKASPVALDQISFFSFSVKIVYACLDLWGFHGSFSFQGQHLGLFKEMSTMSTVQLLQVDIQRNEMKLTGRK